MIDSDTLTSFVHSFIHSFIHTLTANTDIVEKRMADGLFSVEERALNGFLVSPGGFDPTLLHSRAVTVDCCKMG